MVAAYMWIEWLAVSQNNFNRVLIGSCMGYVWVHDLAKSMCQSVCVCVLGSCAYV